MAPPLLSTVLALVIAGIGSASAVGLAVVEPAPAPTVTTVAVATPTTTAPVTTMTTVAPVGGEAAPPPTTAPSPPEAVERVTVRVTPERPKAGDEVHLEVDVAYRGYCCLVTIDAPGAARSVGDPGAAPCSAGPDGTQTSVFTLRYNTPGTMTVTALVESGRACDDLMHTRERLPAGSATNTAPASSWWPRSSMEELPRLSASATIEVAAGITVAQGPERPELVMVLETLEPAGTVALVGNAFDRDGWLSEVQVDWGDGTAPTVVPRKEGCTQNVGGWPGGGAIALVSVPPTPSPWITAPPTHTYAGAGPYPVTVTGVSTGCDGSEEQRTTVSLRALG